MMGLEEGECVTPVNSPGDVRALGAEKEGKHLQYARRVFDDEDVNTFKTRHILPAAQHQCQGQYRCPCLAC